MMDATAQAVGLCAGAHVDAAHCACLEALHFVRFWGEGPAISCADDEPTVSGVFVTTPFRATFPIRRPYTALFMAMRDQLNRLIDQMERESDRDLPPSDRLMVTEEWEAYNHGLIIGRIDWDAAALVLTWAVNDDAPIPSEHSPAYVLNLSELRQVALDTPQPRDCFESYALYLLSEAQHHLVDFFRDGPTDDIPYNRHTIFAQGIAGQTKPIWVHVALFTFDDQH
jgi:hypothetical protein